VRPPVSIRIVVIRVVANRSKYSSIVSRRISNRGSMDGAASCCPVDELRCSVASERLGGPARPAPLRRRWPQRSEILQRTRTPGPAHPGRSHRCNESCLGTRQSRVVNLHREPRPCTGRVQPWRLQLQPLQRLVALLLQRLRATRAPPAALRTAPAPPSAMDATAADETVPATIGETDGAWTDGSGGPAKWTWARVGAGRQKVRQSASSH